MQRITPDLEVKITLAQDPKQGIAPKTSKKQMCAGRCRAPFVDVFNLTFRKRFRGVLNWADRLKQSFMVDDLSRQHIIVHVCDASIWKLYPNRNGNSTKINPRMNPKWIENKGRHKGEGGLKSYSNKRNSMQINTKKTWKNIRKCYIRDGPDAFFYVKGKILDSFRETTKIGDATKTTWKI